MAELDVPGSKTQVSGECACDGVTTDEPPGSAVASVRSGQRRTRPKRGELESSVLQLCPRVRRVVSRAGACLVSFPCCQSDPFEFCCPETITKLHV